MSPPVRIVLSSLAGSALGAATLFGVLGASQGRAVDVLGMIVIGLPVGMPLVLAVVTPVVLIVEVIAAHFRARRTISALLGSALTAAAFAALAHRQMVGGFDLFTASLQLLTAFVTAAIWWMLLPTSEKEEEKL